MRRMIRDRLRTATCLGFGPRFLHSTGQAYKGGPNSGVFLQITCEDAADLAVPGQAYSFGVVKGAEVTPSTCPTGAFAYSKRFHPVGEAPTPCARNGVFDCN